MYALRLQRTHGLLLATYPPILAGPARYMQLTMTRCSRTTILKMLIYCSIPLGDQVTHHHLYPMLQDLPTLSRVSASGLFSVRSISIPFEADRLTCGSIASIMAAIMHKVYAIRSVTNRTSEAAILEERLDKWYIGLPEHLQYNCPKSDRIPAPHIVTLHMDYWCTVLLLHRPLCVSPYLSFMPEKPMFSSASAYAQKGKRAAM